MKTEKKVQIERVLGVSCQPIFSPPFSPFQRSPLPNPSLSLSPNVPHFVLRGHFIKWRLCVLCERERKNTTTCTLISIFFTIYKNSDLLFKTGKFRTDTFNKCRRAGRCVSQICVRYIQDALIHALVGAWEWERIPCEDKSYLWRAWVIKPFSMPC